MAKKVKITENCIITSDDKGQRSLVGKAKEALTTLDKNKIDITIVLDSTSKEDAEKFLKENNVPYTDLITMEEQKKGDNYDAFVVGDPNVILLSGDWTWTLESIVDKLYNNREKPEAQRSEQTKMDDKFKDYKHWAEEANEARKKRQAKSDIASA
jgi:hypothetical protein